MKIQQYLKEYSDILQVQWYSPKTIKSYIFSVKQFLTYRQNNFQKINSDIMMKYLLKLQAKWYANKTIHKHICAIKTFYLQILWYRIKLNFSYPKTSQKLPVVLSRTEIQSILDNISNIKHKTMVAISYGAGLRVSEVVKLKVQDVDLENLTLHIRLSKWNKSRISIVSEKLVSDLRALCEVKKGEDYLFSSEQGGCLHTRSLQNVFHKAIKKAWIKKDATFHSLRHSFATHLIENGVDVTYIQKLLGHSNVRTTMIYTQVSNSMLQKIVSPF